MPENKTATKSAAKNKKAATRSASRRKQKSNANKKNKAKTTRATALQVEALVDTHYTNFTPYSPKKSENYMSAGQLDHFRDILIKWRMQLMEEVDRTVNHMQDEAANFPDPADRATQEEEFSIELKTRDRERKLTKKIAQTLGRIDQEDYGYCDTCGVEIGLRRLEARPTASQCVDCKSLEELRERQLHG
jgi:DnaK suppressor protein